MYNSFSVVVLHRSMVNLKRGALVHVNSVICKSFFACSSIPYISGQFEGVHLPSIYVNSTICETYSV